MSQPGPNSSETRSPARRLFLIVTVALLIRLAVIPFTINDILSPARDHWHFGYEEGRIARSIATGKGFGSPLFGETGLTAWTNPIYPYILAAVFKIFGVYTAASAWVALGLNGLFSALTCIPIYFSSRKVFRARAGWWAAWLWCLFPYAIYLSAGRVWEYCLDALAMTLVVWVTLEIAEETSLKRWVGYGFVWGLAGLTNAVILSTLPLMLLWIVLRRRETMLEWPRRLAIALLALVVTVSPWFVRNYATFGRFIPFRDAFWLAFTEGNTGDTSDLYPDWTNPSNNDGLLEKYRTLGELAFMQERRAVGLAFLKDHTGLFVRLCVKRAAYVWTGYWSFSKEYLENEPTEIPNIGFCTALTVLMILGIRRAWRAGPVVFVEAIPFLIVVLVYPLIYYIVYPGIGYKHPVDPMIAVFIAYWAAGRRRNQGSGAGISMVDQAPDYSGRDATVQAATSGDLGAGPASPA